MITSEERIRLAQSQVARAKRLIKAGTDRKLARAQNNLEVAAANLLTTHIVLIDCTLNPQEVANEAMEAIRGLIKKVENGDIVKSKPKRFMNNIPSARPEDMAQ